MSCCSDETPLIAMFYSTSETQTNKFDSLYGTCDYDTTEGTQLSLQMGRQKQIVNVFMIRKNLVSNVTIVRVYQ